MIGGAVVIGGGGGGAGDGGGGAGAITTAGAGLCLRACAAALGRGVLGSGFFSAARAAGDDGDDGDDGADGILSGARLGTGVPARGVGAGVAGVAERGTATGRRKAIDTVLSCGVASTATVCSVTNKSCPPTSTRARTA
jgi:hypothetical protein